MMYRLILRSPDGEVVRRDVSGGHWAEPVGSAETTVGEDWWALPGLVDAHAHLAVEELDYQPGVFEQAADRARAALTAGITLILDKGWTDDTTIRLIEEVPENQRPEIEAAARMLTSPGGYITGFAEEITGGQVEEAVRRGAIQGRGWVKLIGDWPRRGIGPLPNFTEDELRLAVRVASEQGARVAIHTMAKEVPSAAVRAGVQSIEHGLFLQSDDLDALAERGGIWVPTVLRIEETIAQLGSESSGGKLLLEGLANTSRLLPQAVEAGVHVLAGTDLVGSPADVAAEAFKLRDYGLSIAEVVRAVSTSGFEATGRATAFDVGSPADAVFFPANPLEDLAVLTDPVMVIREGRVV